MDNVGKAPKASDMLTVSLLIDSFQAQNEIAVKMGQMKPATRDFYSFQLRKLRAAAGSFPAAELRAHHLISVTITNHFARAIKRLMKWALDEEFIPANRFAKLRVPPTGQRTRILRPDEFRSLLRVSDPCFRQYLTLAAETAARPGELRQLRWDQVQPEQRQILLTNFKGKAMRRDGVSVRQIPLTRTATKLLEVLRRRAAGEWVFPQPGKPAEPLSANTLRLRMAAARKRAGLSVGDGERVVCYTLRHTRATELTRKGVRDNTLATIMGHTNTQMTRRYQHLTGADLCNVLDQADAK
jgi:integrase